MKKIILILALGILAGTSALAQQDIRSFSPKDNGKALVNPGMGWMLYYYSNVLDAYGSKLDPEDTVEDFPGVGTVFLRLPWAFLEPEKDKFNWEIIDTPAQRWLQTGRQVAFCISATEQWTRQGTPQWVFDEGAKYYEASHFVEGDRVYDTPGMLEPDYDDPIFLKNVEHLVERMAERYDGDPAVSFFAIGLYGMWGEGHTVLTTPSHGHSWGDDTKKKYIDIYTRHFKKTQLCISDDYAGHNDRRARFEITDYSRKKGVTIKDDSILVEPDPNPWYHDGMAQIFWPDMPVILEHAHLSLAAWDPELLLKSVEDYHASFMSIHWWPREELQQNREIIDRINRRIGYRINLEKAEWPGTIRKNEPFHIRAFWKNMGVAPCYGGGYPCFTIKNKKGGIVAVLVDTGLNVKDLAVAAPGEAKAVSRDNEFIVAQAFSNAFGTFSRTCQTGEFDIFFSVGTAYGSPTLALPYEGDDGHHRYKMGKIKITE
ncbi:MAG: DUF4832 domain-containing protein [Bacteroidales bacterium]|nr:DUF4832 domain-containing protein [Bacteroidales bacterium]